MDAVQLRYVNQSNDTNNSKIVFYQKNVATDFDELSVAWTVIERCGQGDHHPFALPLTMEVNASDSWGNYTPDFAANPGDAFAMQLNPSGDQLAPDGSSVNVTEVEVKNNLATGSINANIFKDGKLLAAKTNVVPNQKAVFQFKPTLFVGAVSQVVQGKVMNSAIMSQANTELSLLGVASADIVMTGGGQGPNSTPFTFHLDNVTLA